MVAVLPQVVGLKRIVFDLLFPRFCINCGREGDLICADCRRLLSCITPPVCAMCGRPLSDGTVCPECSGVEMRIDGIRSPFAFRGVIRRAVHQLKYQNLRVLVGPLAGFLRDYLTGNPLPADVLVPVPLHKKRLRERGYNQSALLARELGRLCGLPVVENCLVRRLHTPPQARSASIVERQENINGAFACLDDRVQGRHVLLIDDVSTSGTTLDACAGELKSAGADSVWGLTVALEL